MSKQHKKTLSERISGFINALLLRVAIVLCLLFFVVNLNWDLSVSLKNKKGKDTLEGIKNITSNAFKAVKTVKNFIK